MPIVIDFVVSDSKKVPVDVVPAQWQQFIAE
jgi:hypothetical protein